jgi:hypothetical protein
MLPLLLSAVVIALVRRDYIGLGVSTGIAVVVSCAFLLLAPSRWFARTWTPEERDEVIERWERIPVVGLFIRFGEWRRRKVTGRSCEPVAGDPIDSAERSPDPTPCPGGDPDTRR